MKTHPLPLFAIIGRKGKIRPFQLYQMKLKADHKDDVSSFLLYLLKKLYNTLGSELRKLEDDKILMIYYTIASSFLVIPSFFSFLTTLVFFTIVGNN